MLPSKLSMAGTERHDPGLDRYVGARIALQRQACCLTASEVAEQLDVPPSDLLAWEAGARRVPPRRLFDLAHVFTCSIAFFFEGIGEAAALAPTEEAPADKLRRLFDLVPQCGGGP